MTDNAALGILLIIAAPCFVLYLAWWLGARFGESRSSYAQGFRSGYAAALQLRQDVEEALVIVRRSEELIDEDSA